MLPNHYSGLPDAPKPMKYHDLYEKDFYQWTEAQASHLKLKQFEQLDLDNLIDEIESLGRNDRDKLISSLKVLLAHLLKWQFQPDKRTKSWKNSIFRERSNIAEYLEDIPSLEQFLTDEWIEKAYQRGLRTAIEETELDKSVFPKQCPYSLEQIRDKDFLPWSKEQ